MNFNDINKIDCDIASFRISDNEEVDTDITIKYNENIEKFIDVFKERSCLELSTSELSLNMCRNIVNRYNPAFVEFSNCYDEETHLLTRELSEKKTQIIISKIPVDIDFYPSWILGGIIDDIPNTLNTIFQLSVFHDVENSWNMLKSNLPEMEIKIETLETLSQFYRILIELDFSKDNIVDILHTMPSILGISMSLSSCSSWEREFSKENIISVLSVLHAYK
jgi:hypothetical protein